jgi:hypothetical protein
MLYQRILVFMQTLKTIMIVFFFFLKKGVFIARVIFVRINFYISLISFKLLLSKYFNRSLIPKLVNFIALVNHTASIRTM